MADSLPADSGKSATQFTSCFSFKHTPSTCVQAARPSWLFRSEPHKSLIQLFHALHTAFDSAFVLPLVRPCCVCSAQRLPNMLNPCPPPPPTLCTGFHERVLLPQEKPGARVLAVCGPSCWVVLCIAIL